MKTAMDYNCFIQGIDTRVLGEKLLNVALYASAVSSDDLGVCIMFEEDGFQND